MTAISCERYSALRRVILSGAKDLTDEALSTLNEKRDPSPCERSLSRDCGIGMTATSCERYSALRRVILSGAKDLSYEALSTLNKKRDPAPCERSLSRDCGIGMTEFVV